MMVAMTDYFHKVSPCKGCKKRFQACHSICEEYKAWHNEGLELKRKIVKEKYSQDQIDEVKFGYMDKEKKRKAKRWRKL